MRKTKYIKILLALGLLFLLVFPYYQSERPFFEFKELKGSFSYSTADSLSVKSWFSGSYQDSKDIELTENFSFRRPLIRLYNQINYSFFKTANVKKVVVGKQNYLYEENYIHSYYGRDFIGSDSIQGRIDKLISIQDTLSYYNTKIMLVFASGKGYYYPEFFPDRLKGADTTQTNYNYFKKSLKNTDLHLIDFNEYFLAQKDSAKNCLYPKTGIHWSYFSEVMALDSMLNYIDLLYPENTASLNITSYKKSAIPLKRDADIEEAMNLLFRIKNREMTYPEFRFETDSSTFKPKVIAISDSFYWGIFNMGVSTKAFSDGKFWYYNTKVFPDSYEKSTLVKDIDAKQQIEDYDLIILMATESTLHRFPYGFIEMVYPMYFKD